MTKDYALFLLNQLCTGASVEAMPIIPQYEFSQALNVAIKALEQETLLDKVRAEIAEYGSIWVEYKITGRSDKDIEQLVSDVLKQAKEQVLDVIDKYKVEREEQI